MSYTQQEIEDFALNGLSSFDGLDGYTGSGDELLQFGGPHSNFGQSDGTKYFRVVFTNQGSSPGQIWINPGLDLQAQGAMVDGIFTDISGNVTIEATTLKSIAKFRAMYTYEPQEIHTIRIQSSSSTQVSEPLLYGPDTGWDYGLPRISFRPSNAIDQHTQRDDIVVFKTPGMTLARDTTLQYIIYPGSVTMEFWGGASVSLTGYLNKARTKAAYTYAQSQGRPIGPPPRFAVPGKLNG